MSRSFKLAAGAASLALVALPAVLRAEAPPAPPPLDAYGNLPEVEDTALSDSGQRMAFVTKIKGERTVIALEGTKLLVFSPIGDAKMRSLEWIGEDELFLRRSDTVGLGYGFLANKAEIASGILLKVGGGDAEYLFARDRDVDDAVFGEYGMRKVGGRFLGYFGGIELERMTFSGTRVVSYKTALFEVDMELNKARKIAPTAPEGHWRDWMIDGDGKIAAVLDVTSANGNWSITNAAKQVIASGVSPEGDVSLIALGQNGESIVYWIEDEAGDTHWIEVPLAGGEPHYFKEDAVIDGPIMDKLSGRLIGYRQGTTNPVPVFFDPARQEAAAKIQRAFKGLNPLLQQWTPDFSTVLVQTNGNADSGTLWKVDLTRLAADPIGYERPAIAPAHVGPISVVQYKAADGLEMDGILTLPPGREAKNLPVVMLPHGGPTAQDDPVFDWWAQAFASRGYAVFQPNFRGSTNRDDAFRRAGYGQWGKLMQSDISDGLGELAKRGIVDTRRACIMGASYGGYAALAGVTLQQGLYRCAVAVAGVSDVKTMYDTDLRESGGSRMTRRSLIESLGDPKLLDAVSPRRFAARADAPILLIHGKDDTVVPFRHSTAMADALKQAGKPVEMVVLKEEDHWLSRAATRKQMLEAAMAFVQKHNPAN